MPSKLPLPAHDEIAPSDDDNTEPAADVGTDSVVKKPAKKAADRRSKPRQSAVTKKAAATAPKEAKAKQSIEPKEATEPTGPRSARQAPQPTSLANAKPKRSFARRLLRLLVLSAVLGGLAAAAYLIWPTINTRYIQPVENTAADLSTVQGQLGDIDSRLEGLESLTADQVKTLAANQSRLDEAEAGQLQLTERLDDLAVQIEQQTLRIENLDELAATLSSDQELAKSSAAQQVQVTRTAELMSRARLFLYQANYGLAEADLRDARETLAALDGGAASEYSEVIDRLDRAIANLPEFPVAAAGDLDIAWATLLGPQSTEAGFNATDANEADDPSVAPEPDAEPDPKPTDG